MRELSNFGFAGGLAVEPAGNAKLSEYHAAAAPAGWADRPRRVWKLRRLAGWYARRLASSGRVFLPAGHRPWVRTTMVVRSIKQGWLNRNRILGPHGPLRFTLPVEGASSNRRICDLQLVAGTRWKDTLLRTIEQSYRRAPGFDTAWPVVEQTLRHPERRLSGWLRHALGSLAGALAIDTPISRPRMSAPLETAGGSIACSKSADAKAPPATSTRKADAHFTRRTPSSPAGSPSNSWSTSRAPIRSAASRLWKDCPSSTF